jgi:hypothetical protein
MAEEAGATWLDLNCGCPIYGTLSMLHHKGNANAECMNSMSILPVALLVYSSKGPPFEALAGSCAASASS